MTKQITVLLAGGGTAGHVFPALAVADVLRDHHGIRCVFVGTADRLEGTLVPQSGYDLHHVPALPIPRRPTLGLLRVPGALRASVARCEAIIDEEKAVLAVTFGGYVSFPLAWATARRDMPLIIHEQNSVPGLANKFAARWAERVAVTFPGSVDQFRDPDRVVVTGNPVRPEILSIDEEAIKPDALRHFRLHQRRKTVLVFGGSQGARSLNNAIIDSFSSWEQPGRIQILHAAGQGLYSEAAAGWERARAGAEGPLVRCVDFIDDMAAAYAAADVVICRSGATSIAELTALGKPALLVPYPHATADHQLINGRALAQAGGAMVVRDDELNGRALVSAIEPLLSNDEERLRMIRASRAFGRRDAGPAVARLVLDQLRAKGAIE